MTAPYLVDHTDELDLCRALFVKALLAGWKDVTYHGTVSVTECQPTGSAFYGSPEPNDFDCIVLLELGGGADLVTVLEAMSRRGWKDCAQEGNTSGGDADEDDYGLTWVAVRKASYNAIITTDPAFFYRHYAASCMVKMKAWDRHAVLPKSEVITLFQWVRDGELTPLEDNQQ